MKNIVFVSIIDDDEIIRALLLKILKTIEIEQVELDVAAFEGGIPFFESKRGEDPRNHLIILDGIMPAMDGSVKLNGIRTSIVMLEKDTVTQTFPDMVNGQLQQANAKIYSWKEWDQPAYYERLKKSYDILKNTYLSTDIRK